MCQLLGVSRALVYRKPSERPARVAFYETLRRELALVLGRHPVYGYRRARIELRRRGVTCGYKSVSRAMRESGLMLKKKRRKPQTSDGKGEGRYPNLLRKLKVQSAGQAWVADITYIPFEGGTFYLAVVMDVFLRRVVGYRMGRRIDTELTLGALRDALARRKPAAGWVHHSDRGSQYLSHEYVKAVQDAGGQLSASRKACPYDNAHMESFFKTLKAEEVYTEEYQTYLHGKKNIGKFIDGYYNPIRLHSALGYQSPDQFEASQMPTEQ